MIVPDWLKLHAGSLTPGVRPETTFVLIGGQPLYKLELRPVNGKYACAISNTANGKRLDDPNATHFTPDGAFTGGLERLRTVLGW